MNNQLEIDLQAWIDGELDPGAARTLAQRVEGDPKARAICENLRAVKQLLRAHEPIRTVPDTREFYWARIRQGLPHGERAAGQTAHPRSFSLRWLAWLVPAGAFALAVWFFVRTSDDPPFSAPPDSVAAVMAGHQVVDLSDSMTTLTFYSAKDSMTVVWLGQVDML